MTTAPAPAPVLALDVGRTWCRVTDHDRTTTVTIDSGVSLSDGDGVARLADLVDRAVRAWSTRADVSVSPRALGVATTGGQGTAAAALLDRLAARWPQTDVVVTGDVVAAHAGALGGRPGVVAVAGTGAVALGIGVDGTVATVDGHGPVLGDDGSAHAVGRAGLGAALRHHDGRPGGSATLASAARDHVGPLDRLAATVQASPTAVRDVAAFAPAVATAARAGDPVARELWAAAAGSLASTVVAALTAVSATRLALRGSLFDLDDLVTDRVRDAVADTHPEVVVVSSSGDALDGVLTVLATHDAIHEPLVLRATAGTRGAASVAADTHERPSHTVRGDPDEPPSHVPGGDRPHARSGPPPDPVPEPAFDPAPGPGPGPRPGPSRTPA